MVNIDRFARGQVCHFDFGALDGLASGVSDYSLDANVRLENTTQPLHLYDNLLLIHISLS